MCVIMDGDEKDEGNGEALMGLVLWCACWLRRKKVWRLMDGANVVEGGNMFVGG